MFATAPSKNNNPKRIKKMKHRRNIAPKVSEEQKRIMLLQAMSEFTDDFMEDWEKAGITKTQES